MPVDATQQLVNQLAAELRALREKSGRSLRELEQPTFASDSSLSRYLSGKTLPPWQVVEVLCRLGGRDPRELRVTWQRAREARSARARATRAPRAVPVDAPAAAQAVPPATEPVPAPADRAPALAPVAGIQARDATPAPDRMCGRRHAARLLWCLAAAAAAAAVSSLVSAVVLGRRPPVLVLALPVP